jgi:hypothetical protein
LIDVLVHAWPIGSEPEVTGDAAVAIRMFQSHAISGATDSRERFRGYKKEMWSKILHPKLHFLVDMMEELSKFLKCDWSLWMNKSDVKALKPDFLHDALKRILLQAIVWIIEKQEDHTDVRLKRELRCIPKYALPANFRPLPPRAGGGGAGGEGAGGN